MMYMVYETADGNPISVCSVEPTTLRAGLAYKDIGNDRGVWNESALTWDPLPEKKVIDKVDFTDLFTAKEFEDIVGATRTNDKVAAFLETFRAAEMVDLRSSRIMNAVMGMETLGLLANGRAAEILA